MARHARIRSILVRTSRKIAMKYTNKVMVKDDLNYNDYCRDLYGLKAFALSNQIGWPRALHPSK